MRRREAAARGISLRLGGLYGSDLPSTKEQLQLARRGISMFGGVPDAFTPTLWIGDAASALIAALDRAPSGLYDVVDDEPVRQRQLKTALAAAAGRRRMLSLPAWLVRMMAGPAGEVFTRSLRISNRRFREATGWAPAVRNAIEGMALVGAADPPAPTAARSGRRAPRSLGDGASSASSRDPATVRATLLLTTTSRDSVCTGSSFDGPYNEHLLRDLGGANLALAVVILFAIAQPTAGLVRAVAAAMLVAQVPHFIYHAAHLDLSADNA